MRRGRRVAIAGLALALAGALWSFDDFWRAATAEPPTGPARLDAIVVLTGGGDRLDAAFDLLRQDRADRLYISGAHAKVGVADIMAARPNLPAELADRVEVGHAVDTVGNAAETAAWARANGFQRIALVTAYYHMPRSLILFQAAAPDLELWPVAVEPRATPRRGWWRSADGLAVIPVEWLKYLATRAGLVG